MKIAIIGAGFTGMTAALRLAKSGHKVTIYEANSYLGGLAAGFKNSGWDWTLEHHYHHLFSNDTSILSLAEEVGQKIIFKSPKTSIYFKGSINRFDSPISLLLYPHLDYFSKIKTAALLTFLKLNPIWQPLEKITAKKMIEIFTGSKSWSVLWEPLFVGKFANFADSVSAAWFWARIYKRTPKLGYPEGGFSSFVDKLSDQLTNLGVTIKLNCEVKQIQSSPQGLSVITASSKNSFDRVICTLPPHILNRLYPSATNVGSDLKYLGAANLVLSLKHKFMTDDTYWLNINDRKLPFLAVVEHTNYMQKSVYANEHILYVGNYLPTGHKYFSLSADKLLDIFTPHLKKINPKFTKAWVAKSQLFTASYAQPVVTLNYSRLIPNIKTSIPGLFLASMQQVYPWDRGTNYAVELGNQVAALCIKNS